MTRSARRRAERLRALRDHPSTSTAERAAAVDALRRLGIEPEPDPERARWRRDFDERIIGIELQLIEAEHAARMARIDEDHARRIRERHEAAAAELREQLAHQRAWRETVA